MNRPTRHARLSALLLAILVAMIASCSLDRGPSQSVQDKPNRLSYTRSDATLSAGDAEKEAVSIMCALKPISFRSIDAIEAEVTPLYGSQPSTLRSAEEADAPLAYLVNFKDDNGFAILSANRNCPPILAIHPHGNLDPEKAPDNPTLQMLMERVEEYCLASNGHTETIPDPKHPYRPDGTPIEEFRKVEYRPWRGIMTSSEKVLIPVVWGQEQSPYNTNIARRFGIETMPAGCVPAAIAQILAFHKYPLQIDGETFDWEAMRRHHPIYSPMADYKPAYDYISRLYEILGDKLKVTYRVEGSKVPLDNIAPVLTSLGYSVTHSDQYSYSAVCEEISPQRGDGYPLIICASANKETHKKQFLWWKWEENYYTNAHAFILDGFKTLGREVITYRKYDMPNSDWEIIDEKWEFSKMVRANLGWDDAMCNGYYNYCVFDTTVYPELRSDYATYGKKGVYSYNIQLFTGIRPK